MVEKDLICFGSNGIKRTDMTPEKCLDNIAKKVKLYSIIMLHYTNYYMCIFFTLLYKRKFDDSLLHDRDDKTRIRNSQLYQSFSTIYPRTAKLFLTISSCLIF